MKKARFTESHNISILSRQGKGIAIADIYPKHSISHAIFFNWKAEFGEMTPIQLKRLEELEIENARLKKMYANLSLLREAFKDAVEKNFRAL